jgi:hypothetical protein
MTSKAPSKNWLMKAVELEADCDISAGPVLPQVKVSSVSRVTNGHVHHGHARKAAIHPRPVRPALVKA